MDIRHKDGEFFIEVGGKKAVLDYTVKDGKMDLFRTFTDEELRGRGLAEKLTLAAFEYAKKNGLKVVPTCSYVKNTFLKKRPELDGLVEH